MQNQQNHFLETTVKTSTPEKLLVMLYDGAIRFCNQAIASISEKDYPKAHKDLIRVQDIINEFIITLDHDSPIAENLLKLYEYFNHLLMQANIKKDVKPVEEVREYLKDLRNTWKEADKLMRQKQASV